MLKHVLLTQVMNQITVQPLSTEDIDGELIAERAYECLEETLDTGTEGPLYEALRLVKQAWPEDFQLREHVELLIKEFS